MRKWRVSEEAKLYFNIQQNYFDTPQFYFTCTSPVPSLFSTIFAISMRGRARRLRSV